MQSTSGKSGSMLKTLAVSVLLGSAVLFSALGVVATAKRRSDANIWTVLDASENLIKSLKRDDRVRDRYTDAVGLGATAARTLGERYGILALSGVSQDLERHYKRIGGIEKRGPIDDLANLFGGGGGGSAANMSSVMTAMMGILGGGNMTNIMTGMMTSMMDMMGGSDPSILAGAGMFLGIGLGEGAVQGLNLSTATTSKAVGQRVAAQNNMTASGLNPLIQSAATGATASVIGAVNVSSLTGSTDIVNMLAPGLLGLGQGLGGGAAMGLQLTQKNMAPNPNATDITGIASNFGFGLTNSVTSSINTTSLLQSASNSGVATGLVKMLPVALAGFGKGLGNGAAIGLGAQPDSAVPIQTMPDGSADVSGIAQSFSQGMTVSFLANGTVSSLTNSFNVSSLTTNLDYNRIAQGFGKGLGSGAAIGLGVQPDMPVQAQTMPDGSPDYGSIAQSFSQSLSSSFLANSTTTKLLDTVDTSTLTSSVDYNKVAQGFARGLLQGAGDGVESLGGVQAIIDGTSKMPASPNDVGTSPMQFNDSVSGAAIGFGQGLGSQGVLLVQRLFSNSTSMMPAAVTTSSTTSSTAMAAEAKKPESKAPSPAAAETTASVMSNASVSNITARYIKRSRPLPARRQLDISQGINNVNISLMLSADTISSVMQKGADALTCEGIGGLGLVAFGLYKSGTISFSGGALNANTTKLIKGLLPQGVIRLAVGNTVYEIDGQKVGAGLDPGASLLQSADGIQVNGTKVIPFAVFLVIHILVAIVVMFNLYPIAVAAESLSNLMRRYVTSPPQPLLNKLRVLNKITWVFVMGPSLIILVIFGVLARGNAGHFQTAHGILGLLTTMLGLAAVGLFFVAKPPLSPTEPVSNLVKAKTVVNQLLMLLTAATIFTGFSDLSSMALCFTSIISFDLATSLGFGLGSSYFIGSTLSGAEIFINWRASKKPVVVAEKKV